jgi:molecular chaperone DnaK (HSP70)
MIKKLLEMIKHSPFEIVAEGEKIKVKMGEKTYSPQEISAMILRN